MGAEGGESEALQILAAYNLIKCQKDHQWKSFLWWVCLLKLATLVEGAKAVTTKIYSSYTYNFNILKTIENFPQLEEFALNLPNPSAPLDTIFLIMNMIPYGEKPIGNIKIFNFIGRKIKGKLFKN